MYIGLTLVLLTPNLLLGQKSIVKIKELLHTVEKMTILSCIFGYLSFITEWPYLVIANLESDNTDTANQLVRNTVVVSLVLVG